MKKNGVSNTLPNRNGSGRKLQSCVNTLARVACLTILAAVAGSQYAAHAEQLWAGAAKVDITNREAGPVSSPLYAKALVLRSGTTMAAIVTVDAVAIGEIGHIDNEYLGTVRSQVERELKIPPSNVIVNASHCHGIVRADVDERPVTAIRLRPGQVVVR